MHDSLGNLLALVAEGCLNPGAAKSAAAGMWLNGAVPVEDLAVFSAEVRKVYNEACSAGAFAAHGEDAKARAVAKALRFGIDPTTGRGFTGMGFFRRSGLAADLFRKTWPEIEAARPTPPVAVFSITRNPHVPAECDEPTGIDLGALEERFFAAELGRLESLLYPPIFQGVIGDAEFMGRASRKGKRPSRRAPSRSKKSRASRRARAADPKRRG